MVFLAPVLLPHSWMIFIHALLRLPAHSGRTCAQTFSFEKLWGGGGGGGGGCLCVCVFLGPGRLVYLTGIGHTPVLLLLCGFPLFGYPPTNG